MEDREFFDHIYQEWAKTTGAENRYYIVEEVTFDTDNDYEKTWDVVAVNETDDKQFVANFLHEQDADWFAAVHGCFADLYRRLHEALDEADRLDEQADDQSSLAAQVLEENELLHRDINRKDSEILDLSEENSDLMREIRSLEAELEEKYEGVE